MSMMRASILLCLIAAGPFLAAQQRPDLNFRFPNTKPAYTKAQGPRVCMDTGHRNFQSPERNPGAFQPLIDLLSGDGYRVREINQQFSGEVLTECEILVIATPLGRENLTDVGFPHVGVFTRGELVALFQWIRGGGGLFLITDHQPTLGGAVDLGSMLGVVMVDGYAFLNPSPPRKLPEVFSRASGLLGNHPILRGREATERIDAVGTFYGSAFHASREWTPLLFFGPSAIASTDPGYTVFKAPPELWPTFSISGWLHAGTRRLEKGRVALLAENATCTAILEKDKTSFGMSHPDARQNPQFCLNIVRWLSGVLSD